jgi:hypothetical protein
MNNPQLYPQHIVDPESIAHHMLRWIEERDFFLRRDLPAGRPLLIRPRRTRACGPDCTLTTFFAARKTGARGFGSKGSGHTTYQFASATRGVYMKIPSDFRIGSKFLTVALTIIGLVLLWVIVNGIYAIK